MGPAERAQGRRLHPRPAPRSGPEFRRGAPCAARLRRRSRLCFPRPPRAADAASLFPSPRAGAAPASVARIAGLALPHRRARIAGAHPCGGATRPTPSAKARTAAPGSRTATARASLTGIEMRGPAWRGFSAGGGKTLFRLPGGPGPLPRVAVCEAAIDALEPRGDRGVRGATRSMPRPPAAWGRRPSPRLQQLLHGLAADPAGILIAATDADAAGGATPPASRSWRQAGVRFDAILPPDGLKTGTTRCARRRRRCRTPPCLLRSGGINEQRGSRNKREKTKTEKEREALPHRRPPAARDRACASRCARPCPGQPGCGAGGCFQKPMKGRTPR